MAQELNYKGYRLQVSPQGPFPVRIRIGVPSEGLGSRLDQITAWLDANSGADGWTMTPSGTGGVVPRRLPGHTGGFLVQTSAFADPKRGASSHLIPSTRPQHDSHHGQHHRDLDKHPDHSRERSPGLEPEQRDCRRHSKHEEVRVPD
jgi:hypothetical protein